MAFKMRGSTFYGKGNQSPVKHHKKDEDGNVIHSGHDDKPYGSTDPEYIKKKEESADLFLKGKTKDKDGNIVDIKWAPGPARPKKYKDPYDKVVTKKKSPAKQTKFPIPRAKRLVRKNVGQTTVDSPSADESKFEKSEAKIKKANEILKKEGYSLEEREQMTGAGGYQAAMDWATPK